MVLSERSRRGEACGVRDRGSVTFGALDWRIGRSSTSCSREQIGQFWSSRLWRQNFGTA